VACDLEGIVRASAVGGTCLLAGSQARKIIASIGGLNMSVWLVRAGKHGERERTALEHNLVTIGWGQLPDLSLLKAREELIHLLEQHYPEASSAKLSNWGGQLWSFCHRIEPKDLVVLPLKTQAAIAIGEVAGPYQYHADRGDGIRHVRSVKWLRTDVPRPTFDQDLLHSFGAFLTVCEIKRNNAEERIRSIVRGAGGDGGNGGVIDKPTLDIEQAALDQILGHIQRKFAGHELARLVDAVLRAEGYLTRVSPPGPDGGVDILAGPGSMGFGSPRLCVQVKSSPSPVGVEVLRGLQGVLANFHAEQGLLVCWGGYKSSVHQEARQSFFTIRLWDSGDLVEAILKNHEKFPDDLQAEFPLKRIWALVLEESTAGDGSAP